MNLRRRKRRRKMKKKEREREREGERTEVVKRILENEKFSRMDLRHGTIINYIQSTGFVMFYISWSRVRPVGRLNFRPTISCGCILRKTKRNS